MSNATLFDALCGIEVARFVWTVWVGFISGFWPFSCCDRDGLRRVEVSLIRGLPVKR